MSNGRLQNYVVIAQDPNAEWRCLQVDVRAHSREEASGLAIAELARTTREVWAVELVVEAA
jgi:hypothetical protein